MPESAMTTSHASVSGSRLHLADVVALLGRVPLSVHQLLFRLAIAGVFLRAGLTKIGSWESTVALFADEYKVPVLAPHVAAVLSATFEVGCSALLWGSILLFLLTRGGGAISLDHLIARALGRD